MQYSHPIRRRARELRQFARAATRPAVLRRGVVVDSYWWAWQPNFGDDLTPWLLPRYGMVPVYRRPTEARFAGVGSILDVMPPNFGGAVWGSGLMYDRAYPLPNAHVLAVRGHLTRERIGAPGATALGDPGILVGRHVRRPAVRWDVALIPHGQYRSHAPFLALAESAGYRVRVIDVRGSAKRVAREIGACGAVITTSLHGMVTADAFGIPALWTTLEPPLGGGAFKFLDYESVITPNASRFIAFDERMPMRELLTHAESASREIVDATGDALEAAIARLPEVLGDLPRFPRGTAGVSAPVPPG